MREKAEHGRVGGAVAPRRLGEALRRGAIAGGEGGADGGRAQIGPGGSARDGFLERGARERGRAGAACDFGESDAKARICRFHRDRFGEAGACGGELTGLQQQKAEERLRRGVRGCGDHRLGRVAQRASRVAGAAPEARARLAQRRVCRREREPAIENRDRFGEISFGGREAARELGELGALRRHSFERGEQRPRRRRPRGAQHSPHRVGQAFGFRGWGCGVHAWLLLSRAARRRGSGDDALRLYRQRR